jgi:hypothetical protein
VCLIPEIRFDLDKLCDFVGTVMERKDYCVVCVAEGTRGGTGGGGGGGGWGGGRGGGAPPVQLLR